MIKAKKMALAAVAILATALTFTGCESFGKDDFFGTWTTSYKIDENNKLSGKLNDKVALTIYFDGKTENLGSKSTGKFYQYKKMESGTEAFWYGKYELQDNENFTNGTLILHYTAGYNKDVSDDIATDLSKKWIDEDYTVDEMKQLYKTNQSSTSASDDVFDFVLDGGTLFNGYSSLSCVAKENCTWDVKTRTFSLCNKNNDLANSIPSYNNIKSAIPITRSVSDTEINWEK